MTTPKPIPASVLRAFVNYDPRFVGLGAPDITREMRDAREKSDLAAYALALQEAVRWLIQNGSFEDGPRAVEIAELVGGRVVLPADEPSSNGGGC